MARAASSAPFGAGKAAPSALASSRNTSVAPPTAMNTRSVAKMATRARKRPRMRRHGGPCQSVGGHVSPAGHHCGRIGSFGHVGQNRLGLRRAIHSNVVRREHDPVRRVLGKVCECLEIFLGFRSALAGQIECRGRAIDLEVAGIDRIRALQELFGLLATGGSPEEICQRQIGGNRLGIRLDRLAKRGLGFCRVAARFRRLARSRDDPARGRIARCHPIVRDVRDSHMAVADETVWWRNLTGCLHTVCSA